MSRVRCATASAATPKRPDPREHEPEQTERAAGERHQPLARNRRVDRLLDRAHRLDQPRVDARHCGPHRGRDRLRRDVRARDDRRQQAAFVEREAVRDRLIPPAQVVRFDVADDPDDLELVVAGAFADRVFAGEHLPRVGLVHDRHADRPPGVVLREQPSLDERDPERLEVAQADGSRRSTQPAAGCRGSTPGTADSPSSHSRRPARAIPRRRAACTSTARRPAECARGDPARLRGDSSRRSRGRRAPCCAASAGTSPRRRRGSPTARPDRRPARRRAAARRVTSSWTPCFSGRARDRRASRARPEGPQTGPRRQSTSRS